MLSRFFVYTDIQTYRISSQYQKSDTRQLTSDSEIEDRSCECWFQF
jgi:hypothetical protein